MSSPIAVQQAPTVWASAPTRAEVRSAIPAECFEISTPRSLAYLAGSLAAVALPVALATIFLPLTWAWAPMWVLYAVATGTAAVGLWVLAHECGHGAFSEHTVLQDTVGYTLHSLLLVPYFSWQRSHALHHAKTNHLDDGETHVPDRFTPDAYDADLRLHRRLGATGYGVSKLAARLLFGWPVYLLTGATGAPSRGATNHFWPVAPFATDLFPKRWHRRVWLSALGVVAVLATLVAWAVTAGSVVPVLALYVGPYLVVNAWLVTYTWLQHTDVDIPHFAQPEWSWSLGAFQTVDRPYGRIVDRLHHRIGSTHVAHHIEHRIPHYRADEATSALAAAFPDLYRYDPTPIPAAMWRVATQCAMVREDDDGAWRFAPLTER